MELLVSLWSYWADKMKVRGGKYRGARLKMMSGKKIRPATSRVKSAIFDILPHNLSGQIVLDLFAGSGSLGIEALSRGAEEVIFVDQSQKSARLIRENITKLGCREKSRVIVKKVSTALNQLALEGIKFDLVFIDPPFDQALCSRTLAHLAQSGILNEEAIIVIRHSLRESVEERYGELELKDRRRYGDSQVSFYLFQKEEKEEEQSG